MKFLQRTISCIAISRLIAIGLILFTAMTQAQITALCDSTNPCDVNAAATPGVNKVLTLVWRGTAIVERNTNVLSDSGRFSTPDNIALGASGTPLRQTVLPNAIGTPVQFAVTETLRVPGEFSRRAVMLGHRQMHYTRTFTYEGLSLTATLAIDLNQPSPNRAISLSEGSEPGVTALGINRVNLRFSSGAQTEIIKSNQQLHVVATINFDRAGLLDAVWEVATPASTAGQAVFKPLQNVRQYLAASRQTALQSPRLPSDTAGLYRIRLRIINPQIKQASIELRYQVNQASPPGIQPAVISNVFPESGGSVDTHSEFSWEAQAGAVAYQLEIYQQAEDDTPLTGLLIKAEQTKSLLSLSVFSHLQAGKTYCWRIVALGKDGNITAASELRNFRMKDQEHL